MRFLHALAALFMLGAGAPPAAAHSEERRFSVTVQGSGPDVILIPGLASSSAVWDGTAARLRADHRVHLIQVAGFAGVQADGNGNGPVVAPLADAIAAYIAAQRIEAPAIVGHSLGGATALMLAARHPQSVGRILVVDALPFYSLLFDPSATPDTIRPQADAMRATLVAQTPEQARSAATATIARMVRNEAARPAAIAWSTASDRGVVARAVYDLMTTDLRPELGRISVPLTVIYAHDQLYGVPAARVDAVFRLAYAGAPQTRFERIDDSFHFIMLDQPAAFAAAVASFLEGR